LFSRCRVIIKPILYPFAGNGNRTAYREVTERRKVVLSTIGILAGYWWNASIDGIAMASEFADSNFPNAAHFHYIFASVFVVYYWKCCIAYHAFSKINVGFGLMEQILTVSTMFVNTVPALRGKDYGKSKMRYPDYTETESGLQYKVTC
jgi:hypothetical protein